MSIKTIRTINKIKFDYLNKKLNNDDLINLIIDLDKSSEDLLKLKFYDDVIELFIRDGFVDGLTNSICLYIGEEKYIKNYNEINTNIKNILFVNQMK